MKKWLAGLFAACFLLTLAAFLFLSATDTGLGCLIGLTSRLTANRVTIGSASGSLLGTVHLKNIRYADGADAIIIDTVSLTWNPSQLLNRRVRIHSIRGTGILVSLGKSEGETALTSFSLPGSLLIDEVTAQKISIVSDQEEIVRLRAATITHLTYEGQTLNLDALSLANEEITIQAKGQLLTTDGYPLQCSLESSLYPKGYKPITAHGTVNGPLNELQIRADIHAPFPVHFNGQLHNLIGKTRWQARMESPEVALNEIHQDWPEQRFAKVVLDGQGTLDAYTLQVQAQLPAQKEHGIVHAELEGNGDGLRINTLHLSQGKKELAVKGHLAWNPALTWQAEVSGSHLDPSLFHADWPGDLTGSVTTSGHMTPHGLTASFYLPALQGTLRTFPLAGKGELHLQDNQLHIRHLALRSGSSTLQVNGNVADTFDVTFDLHSRNMAELWPDAQGEINAQGRVTGKRERPELVFKLTGSNVGIDNTIIQQLTMETKGIIARDSVFDCTVRAERLQIGTMHLDLSKLQIKGSPYDHSIRFEGQGSEFSTGFTLEGKFAEKVWQGTLSQTYFFSQRLGDWQQRKGTPLVLSPEKADIKSLCLASSASASLCVNGSWQAPDGSWQLQAAISAFPLKVLQAGSDIPWALDGQLTADIDLAGQQSRIVRGKLSSNSNGMRLLFDLPEGGTHQVTWKKNTVDALFTDNKVRIVLNSELSDNSTLDSELTLSTGQLSEEKILHAPMDGSIRFRIQDMSPLAALTDQMMSLSGALHGQFTVNGTPVSPLINGQMELAKGQAEIPPLGITLSPLQMRVTSNSQTVQLLATAHSGKGFLQAESSLQLNRLASGPHTIHLSGDDFKAAHLPGLDLDINPDLLLIFSEAKTEVRGTVTIPQARITSIDFHNATVPSNDMVIIDDEETAATTTQVPLFTDITVIAGEDVHIDAYGLRGNIAGKLTMRGQPGRPQVGNGTLSVQNGTFTVYGRRLKIDIGRLLFTGGPLTNPGIELRSERKGEKVTTGMIIGGFLQRPEIHFYSSPMMEQSAIVTNLLESTAVGGETRQDIGFIGETFKRVGLGWMVPYLQGMKKLTMVDEIKLETSDDYDSYSLVFGSWLTPDFYVSYERDLTRDSISFNTRYTLGKGFHFLTETGSLHSGGDIKYEFER